MPGEAPRAGAALERFIDAVVTARGADLVSPAAAAQACRILEAALPSGEDRPMDRPRLSSIVMAAGSPSTR
jgi:hypothetical protein